MRTTSSRPAGKDEMVLRVSRRMSPTLLVVAACVSSLMLASNAYAGGDVNRQSCDAFEGAEASPGFRTALPDCRAYELVTPSYEGGQAAKWFGYGPPPVSADGNHVLGLSYGGFAGVENDEQDNTEIGAVYEFSRTSAGWATEALEPPAAQVSRRTFVYGSSDLSRTLWALTVQEREGEEIANPQTFMYAVREATKNGPRFVDVGPATFPGREVGETNGGAHGIAGASHDLEHILINVYAEANQLWPGDATRPEDPSLYEYTGTGQTEPTLVGVKNDGALSGQRYVNERAELISACGTVVGGAGLSGSAYNAVSASGETIFFTARACPGGPAVDSLYARVGGVETVAISEPTAGPAGDCRACEEAEPQAGTFEGASEDGAKAFFLSEQKELLPGAEGKNLYEYDFDRPAHEKLVRIGAPATNPEILGVARVSEDGSHVYFAAQGVLTGANHEGRRPQAGGANLYVFETDTEHLIFVATLSSEDGEDWSAQDLRPVQATADGRFLVFTSRARLTADDVSGEAAPQAFEYDVRTGALTRVSIGQRGVYRCPATETNEEGYNCDGNGSSEVDRPVVVKQVFYANSDPDGASTGVSLAEDGSVIFTSRNALTPLAVTGRENIYEYRDGNVYLLSPTDEAVSLGGEYSLQPTLLGVGRSGADVFFYTTNVLAPQDTDTQASWYDARIGGGFPAPSTASLCSGEACQGPLSAMPGLSPGAGSESAPGERSVLTSATARPTHRSTARVQALAHALRACGREPRRRRAACRAKAKRRYQVKSKAKKSDRRGK